jgi:hypothetical protein
MVFGHLFLVKFHFFQYFNYLPPPFLKPTHLPQFLCWLIYEENVYTTLKFLFIPKFLHNIFEPLCKHFFVNYPLKLSYKFQYYFK